MRRRKTRSLARGNKIYMFAPPVKRAPVRIDRSMPATFEEYLDEKSERERLAKRDRLLAAASASAAPSAAPEETAVDVDTGDDLDCDAADDGEAPAEAIDQQEPQS